MDYWPLKYGRKDGRESRAEEADRYVPMGRGSITDLINFFESRGLNVFDLVVLSGIPLSLSLTYARMEKASNMNVVCA